MRYQLVGFNVGLAALSLTFAGVAVVIRHKYADRPTEVEIRPPVPQPRTSLASIMGWMHVFVYFSGFLRPPPSTGRN